MPNPQKITKGEFKGKLGSLHVDTAATAETGLDPALKMVGKKGCIYSADCGVPCSSEATIEENRIAVLKFEEENGLQKNTIVFELFIAAAKRAKRARL